MEWFPAYVSKIEKELEGLNLPQSPEGLYEPIRYFLGIGGKRVRPVLTMLGAELFGKKHDETLAQALAIELFHNFTLVHDDIMDGSPIRRTFKTVHVKWDVNTGILSGDALLIMAYQNLIQGDSTCIQENMELFNRTALEVCEGQQLDLDFENSLDVSVADYLEMIRLKTSVLLGCALEIGATMAGASEKDRKAVYNFGQNIGIAFQIQDDILDLYGDSGKTGKQSGGDVINNKKTILHLSAINNASQEQLEIIKQLQSVQDPVMKVERTRELYDQLSVKANCEEHLKQYLNAAMTALNEINVPSENKSKLEELAHFLIQRDF